jgi:hypothetical protein
MSATRTATLMSMARIGDPPWPLPISVAVRQDFPVYQIPEIREILIGET